jgi:hypothetical protein
MKELEGAEKQLFDKLAEHMSKAQIYYEIAGSDNRAAHHMYELMCSMNQSVKNFMVQK